MVWTSKAGETGILSYGGTKERVGGVVGTSIPTARAHLPQRGDAWKHWPFPDYCWVPSGKHKARHIPRDQLRWLNVAKPKKKEKNVKWNQFYSRLLLKNTLLPVWPVVIFHSLVIYLWISTFNICRWPKEASGFNNLHTSKNSTELFPSILYLYELKALLLPFPIKEPKTDGNWM